MAYEDRKKEIEKSALQELAKFVDTKLLSVKVDVSYPGHIGELTLCFEGGMALSVSAISGGCHECDPDGMGWGVSIH